ncbi:MAG: 1-propanol dehydrogenase PduQ [Lachnospiraceae bacterium]
MSNIYIKTKVRSGHFAIEYLRKIRHKKLLIVCDKFMSENGGVSYVMDNLDSSNEVTLFDEAVPDPAIETVSKGLVTICRVKPDILIGFGGGSAIDTAKGILYFATVRQLIPKPRFITIPTTSGTGSEVTSAAVITDNQSRTKHLIDSEEILADVAILDPRLTLSVPPAVTANTGMDVLTHALEAYVATKANAFSDALAEKAVELLIGALLTCYQNGRNLEARTNMHEASTLAGMAFNTAGLGVNHSIAHQLGGTFHIPHGLANAILLSPVISYNCVNHDTMQKYAQLVYKVRLVSIEESPQMAVAALKKLITSLMQLMNMPASIRETGLSESEYQDQLQNMVDNALIDNCLHTTPREIGTEGILGILKEIY